MCLKHFIFLLSVYLCACSASEPEDDWISLFNGLDLTGWTASENKSTFSVQDGLIVTNGERSHLFYTGDIEGSEFTNFELAAEVMTTPGANSGIYFHTAYQEEGWPSQGYEAQVNNTHIGEGDYRELKRTGSLYSVRNIYKQLVPDHEWFDYHIKVVGNRIQIRINNCLVVDYLQPEPDSLEREKYKGSGTFALQGHDPHSRVSYKNIRVKILNNQPPETGTKVIHNDTYLEMRAFMDQQHSFTDLGVIYDESFNPEKALDFYYRTGINLGIVLETNKLDQVEKLKTYPVFIGVKSSQQISNKYVDYLINEAGTFPDETDANVFMDRYLESIVQDLSQGDIDIWSGATTLPESMMSEYDQLWTKKRMTEVIKAAIEHGTAIEIDNVTELPGIEFLKTAKELGAKFTYSNLGVNSDMGEMEYIFEAIEQCSLGYKDIYIP